MIIVNLTGGLGNQMFQYAAGKALALSHNTDLKLDLSWFDISAKTDTIRTFDLECFNLPDNIIASDEELKKIKKGILTSRIPKSIKSFYYSFQKNIILEKYFHYDPTFFDSPSNAYISGYWQSIQYFESFSEHIRKDFRFKTPMEGENQKISESIRATSSVSLHIRRGDYITHAYTNQFHGTTSLDYYNNALEYIKKKIDNPHIFIFSDDMDWVKRNFNLSLPTTYIDHNNIAFEDIRLMSLCKHNIIANSTFSWWGAWLNENPEPIIIAPKKWFNDSTLNTKDVIPYSWLKL